MGPIQSSGPSAAHKADILSLWGEMSKGKEFWWWPPKSTIMLFSSAKPRFTCWRGTVREAKSGCWAKELFARLSSMWSPPMPRSKGKSINEPTCDHWNRGISKGKIGSDVMTLFEEPRGWLSSTTFIVTADVKQVVPAWLSWLLMKGWEPVEFARTLPRERSPRSWAGISLAAFIQFWSIKGFWGACCVKHPKKSSILES